MHSYLVCFNDDGILVKETVQATDSDNARSIAQPLHPDLQIIAIKQLN